MPAPNLVLSTSFQSDNSLQNDFLGNQTLQTFTLDHQAAWDAIIAGGHPLEAATNADPTSIQATRVIWGNLSSDGVELTGSGLDQVSDLEALQAALENGIASGAFDTLRVVAGGTEIGRLTFTTGAMTLTSGTQVLSVSGGLPTSIQGLYDMLRVLPAVANFNANDPALTEAIAVLSDYDIDTLRLVDGDSELINLSLGATQLSLTAVGNQLTIDGTFPTSSLGDILGMLRQADLLGMSGQLNQLSDLTGVAITGALLVDADGNRLAEIDGPIEDVNPVHFTTVHVVGTDDPDYGVTVPVFNTEEANAILIETGAGFDSVLVNAYDLYEVALAPLTIDLGADGGLLMLQGGEGQMVEVDFGTGRVMASGYNSVGMGTYELGFVGNRVGADGQGFYDVKGDDGNSQFGHGGISTVVRYDGGAGTDIYELHWVDFGIPPVGPETRGITEAQFLANMQIYNHDDSFLELVYSDDRGTLSGPVMGQLLTNVERVLLSNGAGGAIGHDLADLVAQINPGMLLGTGNADNISGLRTQAETLLGQGGDDLLWGDGFQANYQPDTAATVYRIYQATLDRAPDIGGLNDWTGRLSQAEIDLPSAVAGFVNSAEFQATYGALDNAQFVELLYQNVLGRSADAGGLADWTGRLDTGTSRAQVVLGFSESTEFKANTAAEAAAFARDADPASWSDEIFRAYRATLDRDPDIGGFTDWVGRLSTGTPLVNAVTGFVNSAEFQATYGPLDNGQFVELLYQNVLGRAADAGGLSDWTGRLASGTSRAQVVLGFSESTEFKANMAERLKDWMRMQDSGDTIIGGSDTNTVAGGLFSDTFVFEPGDSIGTSATVVLDLEPWDRVQFSGFIYGSDLDALTQMTQSGNNVVFSDYGVEITFFNTTLAEVESALTL
ncbi:DUF4214 domain-containing protein [Mesobacterium sp. TK19101]|uniref:DUF4214 domain-containing protein n=1 Tax=Mesobacterium hydrothermale TaxID=3111907 RepID=A0ABU6HJN9_9RHOB|nr:DUF4214 domain-containing protein [Mesobacterium sp. TK19101]MEC3862668.1 DUF4214 domain-containing protein [Mesobacterium sp. TK19101]